MLWSMEINPVPVLEDKSKEDLVSNLLKYNNSSALER